MFQTELIEKCKNNDRKAQLHLYRQYCEGMFIVANRFLKHTEDAEDAMQEAFVNAFQKIDQYEGAVEFGAWLKKIVINKCLDFLRSKKRNPLVERMPTIETPSEESSWEIEKPISIEEVKKAIIDLPERYKQVLMLYLIEGYNHEEIAQILNISIITSRTQLMRGKQKLKSFLKNKYYGSRY